MRDFFAEWSFYADVNDKILLGLILGVIILHTGSFIYQPNLFDYSDIVPWIFAGWITMKYRITNGKYQELLHDKKATE